MRQFDLLPLPRLARLPDMGIKIEKISAITLKVARMDVAVRFYRDVLGMEVLYGGSGATFFSLRMGEGEHRIIFHVADVDSSWSYLKQKGFEPDRPRDASWGERYFHMRDPDGNEISFAR